MAARNVRTPRPVKWAAISSRLMAAAEKAAVGDYGVESLKLDPVAKGIPSLDIGDSLVGAQMTLTIEGASTLDLTVHDPRWLVERSGLLDVNRDGRMDAINVVLDSLPFRLVKASRNDEATLTLTFEALAVALLKSHNKPRAWSRGKYTRAQAIGRMVAEVRTPRISYWSPEHSQKQPRARPNYPDSAPTSGDTGFDKDTKFKIKGAAANSAQMREVATALTSAEQVRGSSTRSLLALLVAGIGESAFRDVPNEGGSPYQGVFQSAKSLNHSTETQARLFMAGGGGYQAGGAIKLARANPNMSVGEIATKVEASGKPPSFYDKYRKEADNILEKWGEGGGGGSEPLYVKSFQFTRGQPGDPEHSWDAMLRLAGDVRWRVFAVGNTVAFVSDDYLITQPALFVFDDPHDDGLLERPSYDWDHGKAAAEANLTVRAKRWTVWPGSVMAFVQDGAVNPWGPVKGRWLVESVEWNLLDPENAEVTLTKPMPKLKEPAPELQPMKADEGTPGTVSAKGGARAIVERLAQVGMDAGGSKINIGSDYRPGSTVSSGGASDHSSNDENKAARDICQDGVDANVGPPTGQLDRVAHAIGKAVGRDYNGAHSRIVDNVTWRGYRVQIIWRTPEYGGHLGHVHVGVRKK